MERRERYKSPTPDGPKRCPWADNVSRSVSAPKRCVSAERKRPTTTTAAKLPESALWPVSRPTTTPDDDTTTTMMKKSSRPKGVVIVAPSTRRLSLDGTSSSEPLEHKSASDLLMQISRDVMSGSSFVDDRCSVWTQRPSSSRGLSPSRRNFVTPRPVFSFNADIKKAKKDAGDAEDIHQLRLLHNRYMQWVFANARADAAMRSQKTKAEKMLYNAWRRKIADLLVSAREKRCNIQQLKLKLKLFSILKTQVTLVDEWGSMERDYNKSLKWAIQHLQDITLRIPVTGGARYGDVESVEAAVGCVIDVMGSMEYSLCSFLSQVERMNCMVSELADLAARERDMFDECESLLSSAHQLQVEENSLRTHLLQMIQACKNGRKPSALNGY